MDIQLAISRQRIEHIVESYHLRGNQTSLCDRYLDELMEQFPLPAIELALVETLTKHWLTVPIPRGEVFFEQAHELLKQWKDSAEVKTAISMAQFRQITGLDPAPVFGPEIPPQFPLPRPVAP